MFQRIVVNLRAGLLIAVLGAVAWASGRPFVFPSLGPTAFVLSFETGTRRPAPLTVLGGHVVGAVAGLLAWTALAGGVPITATPAALSVAGARLAASGAISVALTGYGMVAIDAVHPPACATTLIVSLGLLSTPVAVLTIVVGVAILVGADAGLEYALEWRRSRSDSRSEEP